MINSKHFKFEVKKLARAAIDDGLRLSAELVDLEKKIDDPDLSATGKEKARAKAEAKKAEIVATFDKMMKDVRGFADSLIDNAKQTHSIQGEQMTDDALLFTEGIPLNAEDLKQIIARSKNNHTMLTLCERYRAEHFPNDTSIPRYFSLRDQIIAGAEQFVSDIEYLRNFPHREYVQQQFYDVAVANMERNLSDDDGMQSYWKDFN